jgi:two-component system, NarL family, nitrate/nitrite response regulator NarL
VPAGESKTIRVILIDDHAVVRTGLRLIIESSPGMTMVGEAANRQDGLALAAREQPDIILLDLDLGNDSGIDIIPELLELARDARVIILTGVRDPKVHHKAVLLGAMGLVSKEKAAEVLIRATQRVYAGEAWLDPAIVAGVLSEVSPAGRAKRTDRDAEKIATLTRREREVVELVGQGMKSQEVADRLCISETTVRHHLTSIFDKLEVSDRVELLMFALRHGLASPPR